MSTTTQPSKFTQPNPNNPQTTPLLHNASLAALIICPIIMILPPRKMDIYTFALMTTTFIGGNHLTYEYTGVSMMTRIQNRVISFSSTELSEKGKETQRKIRQARENRRMEESGKFLGSSIKFQDEGAKGEGVLEALEKRSAGEKVEEEKKEALLKRIWLGGEGKDWKKERLQKEKEALEAGKGYGDLIMEQIWEVWTGGNGGKKVEDVKEVDKKVVEEKKK